MRLSTHDATFLHNETASGPMHGVGISIVEGHLAYDEYFAFTKARIHLVPRFRQRLMFVPYNIAHPKWVDDPYFDLANHVKRHVVPEGTSLDEAVQIALELGEPLLDRTRPLWMTYVIEHIEGNTVLVNMSHHAMIDGASGVAAGAAMSDFEADAPPPPPAGEYTPSPLQTPHELWLEAQQEIASRTARTMFHGGQTASTDPALTEKGRAIMQRFLSEPVMTAPFNAAPISPKRSLAWTQFKLDDFKPIRKALGGTINDIVVAAVVESVARYMAEQGEYVVGEKLRLMCPVNVRDEGDTELGNKVSALYPVVSAAPMPMADRLQAVRAELTKLKENDEAQALHALNTSGDNVSPTAMASLQNVGTPFDPTLLAARFPAPVPPRVAPRPRYFGFNFTCTNVVGIPEQTYIAGHKLLFGTGTMMIGGTLGLGVACGSGNGDFVISFTAEPRLLPDVQQLADNVKRAFVELEELAASQAAATSPTPRSGKARGRARANQPKRKIDNAAS